MLLHQFTFQFRRLLYSGLVKELRDAANTMKVIIENKDDFAKVLAEILKEKEVINDAGTK